MWPRLWAVVPLAAAACGRLGFDQALDAGETLSCTSGELLPPVASFNPSIVPDDACGVDRVLALDGLTAGLDRADGGMSGCAPWDPVNGSCGCVGIDLGAARAIGTISVFAAPTGLACGTACGGGACGTGHVFGVLLGPGDGTYAPAAEFTLTGTAVAEYSFSPDRVARHVVVCRQGWAIDRDDVAVDFIAATCP